MAERKFLERAKGFLWPTKSRLVVFGILLVLGYLAMVQAWGFTDDLATKPFLYDYISPFAFWPLVMYLALPAMIVTVPLSAVGIWADITLPLGVAYFYFVSCLVVFFHERFGKKFSRKWLAAVAALFIALNLASGAYSFLIQSFLPLPSGEVLASTSIGISEFVGIILLPDFFAFLFYAYLISGFYFFFTKKGSS